MSTATSTRRGVRIEDVWRVAALVGPFAAAGGTAAFTTDSWWAMRMGQLSFEARSPLTDVALAHTPTIPPLLDGRWLAHVALYVLHLVGGDIGIRVACGLLTAATFWILFQRSHYDGASPKSAAVAVLMATFVASANLVPRAQLLALPLFSVTFVTLFDREPRYRMLWILFPVFALWSNVHSSFLLGLGLIGLLTVGRFADQLRFTRMFDQCAPVVVTGSALLLVCFTATLLNPLGAGAYEYIRSVYGHPAIAWFEEWQRPGLPSASGTALMLSCVATAALIVTGRRRLSVSEAGVLLVFGYLAWSSARHVVWWALVTVPIVAVRLDALLESPSRASREGLPALNTLLALLLLVVGGTSPAWRPALAARQGGTALTREYSPVQAAEFVAGLPPKRRLFHYQAWKGYLGWRLWPDYQPFLDGRIEAHPLEVWEDYLAITDAAPDWGQRLDKYRVDVLLLHKGMQPRLVQAVSATSAWRLSYEDGTAVVFVSGTGVK